MKAIALYISTSKEGISEHNRCDRTCWSWWS